MKMRTQNMRNVLVIFALSRLAHPLARSLFCSERRSPAPPAANAHCICLFVVVVSVRSQIKARLAFCMYSARTRTQIIACQNQCIDASVLAHLKSSLFQTRVKSVFFFLLLLLDA